MQYHIGPINIVTLNSFQLSFFYLFFWPTQSYLPLHLIFNISFFVISRGFFVNKIKISTASQRRSHTFCERWLTATTDMYVSFSKVTPGPETQGMEQTAQSAPPVEQAGEKAGPQVLVQILPGQQGQHPLTAANPPPEQQYLPQYHLPNQHPEPQYMPQYYLPMHHPPWFTHSGLPRGMPFQPAMQQPPFQPALQQPAIQPALQPAMQPNPQQPGPQPAHQPAVQAPLQPLLQGVPVPIQPIQQAPPPMVFYQLNPNAAATVLLVYSYYYSNNYQCFIYNK